MFPIAAAAGKEERTDLQHSQLQLQLSSACSRKIPAVSFLVVCSICFGISEALCRIRELQGPVPKLSTQLTWVLLERNDFKCPKFSPGLSAASRKGEHLRYPFPTVLNHKSRQAAEEHHRSIAEAPESRRAVCHRRKGIQVRIRWTWGSTCTSQASRPALEGSLLRPATSSGNLGTQAANAACCFCIYQE